MMRLPRVRLPRVPGGDDGGWAMLIVMSSMLLATAVATVALTAAGNQVQSSRRDQDFTAALQAARAGIEDFTSHLNADSNYPPNFGTPSDTTRYNNDPANPALVPVANTTTWEPIATATGPDKGSYHYSIIATGGGNVTVKGVGRAGLSGHEVTRTLEVQLGRSSFLKNLYMTKYEVLDPYALQNSPTVNCAVHGYDIPPTPGAPRSGSCLLIQFGSQDTLRGPVYSQDQVRISGSPTFQGSFSTGYNTSPYYVDAGGAAPSFTGGAPFYEYQDFPSVNTSLRGQADRTAGGAGCLYSGPTRIVFGYAAGAPNGTMTVTSPFTTAPASGCSDTASAMGTAPHTFPVPDGKVIWVDAAPPSTDCSNAATQTAYASIGFPIAGDNSFSQSSSRLRTSCNTGDAYVQGWVKGQVTIGTSNNIVITDDLRYVGLNGAAYGTAAPNLTADSSGVDVLGLSASNFVEIYHPISCTSFASPASGGNCTGGSNVTSGVYPNANIQVDAAMVSSTDSFIVPYWNIGAPLGQLTILGAIAQNFRGPVATTGGSGVATGYAKNYNYDQRLLTGIQPPYLATLAAQRWGVMRFSEIKNG